MNSKFISLSKTLGLVLCLCFLSVIVLAQKTDERAEAVLKKAVQAMGGDLEIVAHCPDRADGKRTTIRLKPFAERATPERVD